jgi:hypothetical protein
LDTGTPPVDSQVPESTASGPSAAGARPVAPPEVGAILGEAWSTFAAAWPACLVVYWGAVAAAWLILVLLTAILASFNVLAGEREITPFLEFVRFLGLFVVPAWLWIGQNLAFLKIARRESVSLEDLFRGGPWLLTTLLATGILLAVAAIPCLLIYGMAEALVVFHGGDTLTSMIRPLLPTRGPEMLASLVSELVALTAITMAVLGLSYAAFLAITVRLGLFPYLIIDQGAGVLESHRMSLQLTSGRVATVFLVYLAQLTINLAGLLAFNVGLLLTLPMTSLISAVTYDALCGHPDAAARSQPEGSAESDAT